MAACRNLFALFILCLVHLPAQAQTETILQTFGYFPQGLSPCGTIIRDSSGDLYGTTLLGGATDNGVVFERGAGGKYKSSTASWELPTPPSPTRALPKTRWAISMAPPPSEESTIKARSTS